MRADALIERIDRVLVHLGDGIPRKELEALRLEAVRERTHEELETQARLELERARRRPLPRALARELEPHAWDGK